MVDQHSDCKEIMASQGKNVVIHVRPLGDPVFLFRIAGASVAVSTRTFVRVSQTPLIV